MTNKEEVTIYWYQVNGTKFYTPSIEFAHARATHYGTNVYGEKYLVDVIEAKEKK